MPFWHEKCHCIWHEKCIACWHDSCMLHISLLRIGHALSGYIIPKESEKRLTSQIQANKSRHKKTVWKESQTVDEVCNVKSGYQKQSKKKNDCQDKKAKLCKKIFCINHSGKSISTICRFTFNQSYNSFASVSRKVPFRLNA